MAVRPSAPPVIRLIDHMGFAPQQYAYGQSIFIIEGLHVTELKVYKYDFEKVYAVRWNGVRTSVGKDQVVFLTEQGATEALHRKNGAQP